MQIVIDIDEEIYTLLMTKRKARTSDVNKVYFAIASGTPLPEHHGRLIDADRTLSTAWANFYKHEDEWEKKDNNYLPFGRMYDQNGFECCQQTIINAPTIIEGSDSE